MLVVLVLVLLVGAGAADACCGGAGGDGAGDGGARGLGKSASQAFVHPPPSSIRCCHILTNLTPLAFHHHLIRSVAGLF